ncbi:MAG TPA: ABC transporter permease [Bryobacteraceae bacterium]|nr:ABC transporter permease [Bryobacteraceae bacterium]
MRLLTMLGNTARSLFRKGKADSELRQEFQYHLEKEIENNIRAGMTPAQARNAALSLIGPITLQQEECRDSRGINFIETSLRDLRHAISLFRRTPLFTAAAIATLALGIGANTTVFTFVENILLRPLPVRAPQQLVSLGWGGMINFSYPSYLDLRDRNRAFSDLVAYRFNPASMSLQPRVNYRVWGYEATGNYFGALGVQPELGRFFGPGEDMARGANPVMVMSDRVWRERLAADPNVIGREVKINGYPFTIIGVAPPDFGGTELIVAADYWVPMSMSQRIEPGSDWLGSRYAQNIWVMGRLKPGVTPPQAEANLNQIGQELAAAYPNSISRKDRFRLSSPGLMGQALRGPITSFGAVLMCVGGLVLLLACVNLAGMLMARAADRRREIGIRLAIGAGKGRLLRQLMTESLLLASVGGLLGASLAFGACRLFNSWRLNLDVPIRTSLQPNAVVLAFTAAAALFTTLLFGLMPAVQAIRTDLIPSLKNSPAARLRRWSARDLIVVGQIALSVILVICSVLVVRSLQHALTLKLGFEPANAVSLSFDLRLQGYDKKRSRTFDAALISKASAIPGMQAVGIINNFPLRIGEDNSVVSRTDRPVPPTSERRGAVMYNIAPGYLQAAGTKLVAGRDFSRYDRDGAPAVAIVNQALADALYPNENPLGRNFRITLDAADKGIEIVGIVETGKYESLGEDPKPVVFQPIAQTGTEETTLVARTVLPPEQATESLRKAVLELDPELTIYNAGGLKEQLALPLFAARAAATVLGVFGFLAMVLAATGLFGLMAYAVARRTRELGIRMALGAQALTILSAVLKRTLALCGAGLCLGTVVTLAASRLLSAVLYGVSPRDPATYAIAILLMAVVAVLACWSPATRAIHVDPARTLREE